MPRKPCPAADPAANVCALASHCWQPGAAGACALVLTAVAGAAAAAMMPVDVALAPVAFAGSAHGTNGTISRHTHHTARVGALLSRNCDGEGAGAGRNGYDPPLLHVVNGAAVTANVTRMRLLRRPPCSEGGDGVHFLPMLAAKAAPPRWRRCWASAAALEPQGS
jgi:hypothetical protein